jgi:hypothetical protein
LNDVSNDIKIIINLKKVSWISKVHNYFLLLTIIESSTISILSKKVTN